MIFRLITRLLGVLIFAVGVYFALEFLVAGLAGAVSPLVCFAGCAISLGLLACSGLLFIFFDPHKVIRLSHLVSVHELIKPKERRSFSDRITVSDEEEGNADGYGEV